MTHKTIVVVKDFHKEPYGRYPEDGDSCGQFFRDELLAPAIKKYDHVVVDLTGYNRYGPSFIDEAFGGLIRESKIDAKTLANKLKIKHDLLPSIVELANERIEKARSDTEQ